MHLGYNGRKGEHVTKPQGYRQAAYEQFFCLIVLCLPYYQSLLFAGMGGTVSFLLLTLLLLFVVGRSPAICRSIATCLNALPSWWIATTLDSRERWIAVSLYTVSPEPSLASSFQRPPPLFS